MDDTCLYITLTLWDDDALGTIHILRQSLLGERGILKRQIYLYFYHISKTFRLKKEGGVKNDDFCFLSVKFIYFEKATKFCKIYTNYLFYVPSVKKLVKISQYFVAFSEYMNLTVVIFTQGYLGGQK